MSVEAINAVFERSAAKGSRRLILLALANFADANGEAWPSVGRLAKMTNMGSRNAGYCINDLEADGELTIGRGTAPHGCNMYRINCIGWAERPKAKAKRGAIPCTPASVCTPPAKAFRKGVQASAPEPSYNHQTREGVLSHTAADEPDATVDQSAFAQSLSGHAVTVASSAQASPPTRATTPAPTHSPSSSSGDGPPADANKWIPFFAAAALDLTGRANGWRDTRSKVPDKHKALYGRLSGIFGGACGDDVDAAIALWRAFVADKKAKTFHASGEPLWHGVSEQNAGRIAEKWVLDHAPTIAPSTGRRVVDAWTGR